jgi:hypothetical protein
VLTVSACDNEDPVQTTRVKIEREIMELDQKHMKFRKSPQKRKPPSESEAGARDILMTKYKHDRTQLVSRLKALPGPAAPQYTANITPAPIPTST